MEVKWTQFTENSPKIILRKIVFLCKSVLSDYANRKCYDRPQWTPADKEKTPQLMLHLELLNLQVFFCFSLAY